MHTIQRTTNNSFKLQLLVLDSDTPLAVAVVYRPPKPHKDLLMDFADFLGGIIPNFLILIFTYAAPKTYSLKIY